MRNPTDHIYAVYPPSKYCPPGFRLGAWCSHCGAARGIVIPAPIKDVTHQIKAFEISHTGCQPHFVRWEGETK